MQTSDQRGEIDTDGWFSAPARTLHDAIVAPLRETPLELLVAVVAALVISLQIEEALPGASSDLAFNWVLSSVTVFLALVAVSALRMLDVVSSRVRWSVSAAYLAGGVLYATLVLTPHTPNGPGSTPELYRWALLTSALGLGLFLVPLAAREGPGRTRTLVGQFATRLLQRAFIAGTFAYVLFLGLAGALGAISTLFELGVESEVYAHLATWLMGVVAPWTFVAGLPEIAQTELEDPGDLETKLLTHAGNWVFLPLAGLYLAILYVYEARVLVTGEAPKNMLSPLALGAAIMVVVGIFLLDYLRRTDRGRRLVKRLEWLPVAYAPVIPMPIWAVGVRIHQHGWTEFRYVRMLASIGVAVAFGYAAFAKLRGKSPKVQALPATFALVALAGTVGPWSVVQLPRSSQTARLQAELREAGAMKAGEVESLSEERAGELDPKLVKNIQSRAQYLDAHYGSGVLEAVASTELDSDPSDPVARLGLPKLADAEPAASDPTARRKPDKERGQTFVDVTASGTWTLPEAPRVEKVRNLGYYAFDDDQTTVVLDWTEPELKADLSALVRHLENREPFSDNLPKDRAQIPLVDDSGTRHGTLIVRSVEFQRNPDGELEPHACRAWVLWH